MTPKEYLQQAYVIHREINRTLAKIEGMRQSLYGKGADYSNDGSKPASRENSLEKAICKIMDYENEANKKIDSLVDKKLEIEKVISRVSDGNQKEVLERRYLCFQPFDTYYDKKRKILVIGIYDEMNYSRRQIFNFHCKGLREVEKILH